jgi:hypothetical protein
LTAFEEEKLIAISALYNQAHQHGRAFAKYSLQSDVDLL